jgi:histidinol-phosphate phosphatase family protein
MQAVILAGGKATRLGAAAQARPKALVDIGGQPLLDHHLRLLKRYGIDDVILMVGHLAQPIIDEIGDGSGRGMRVRYYREEEPLGTAGGLRKIAAMLADDFLLLYGDIMVDMDLARLMRYHRSASALASLVVHPNDHPYDSDLVEVDERGRVAAFHPKPHPEGVYFRNLVNAAIYVMSPDILRFIPADGPSDFGKDVFPAACRQAKIFAYNSPEYIKDIGTPERLEGVRRDFKDGLVAGRNLERPRPAVFLDRDGVINRELDHLGSVDRFELLPGAAEAIGRLNRAGFLVLVATNQPGVAKGFFTEDTVREIHRRLETEIGRGGAYVNGIYYCPHHPEKGFPGEVESLKIDCECRKPKTGMIDRARGEFNIDVSRSWFVGDSARDIECGRRAGMRTVGVRTGYGCADLAGSPGPDAFAADLADAVDYVISNTIPER